MANAQGNASSTEASDAAAASQKLRVIAASSTLSLPIAANQCSPIPMGGKLIRGTVVNGEVGQFQVTMRVGFLVED